MADKEEQTAAPAKPSFVKRLGKLAGIAALCIAALFGGLAAALGPGRAIALFSGSDSGEAEHVTADNGHDPAPANDHAAPADTGGHGAAASAEGSIVVTPFKEIIVNVTATTATGRQTTRFLKLNVALVYDETRPGAAQIEERKLFLRDSFQDYLRQLSDADLQGSIGLSRLKAELLRRARAVSDSDAPQELLIADLIIQ
ncbi:flagellar motor switch protein M [Oceanicola sp. 22II-s10i]|uniref:flagellar basal body-associated FliL family protein n=1 Tax=Oceanicola sp. 22II-s10i TaxID=1317116 RepID=UPI000B5285C8|nr:flagellar basal body-associated FliL family protein [Oceanicola sp. 22II-s10i]OWU83203.1 flagellar motor switch protein M [Oceanicola sp. 22II-s10i]